MNGPVVPLDGFERLRASLDDVRIGDRLLDLACLGTCLARARVRNGEITHLGHVRGNPGVVAGLLLADFLGPLSGCLCLGGRLRLRCSLQVRHSWTARNLWFVLPWTPREDPGPHSGTEPPVVFPLEPRDIERLPRTYLTMAACEV